MTGRWRERKESKKSDKEKRNVICASLTMFLRDKFSEPNMICSTSCHLLSPAAKIKL